jgi:hypothetical protein
LLGGCPFAWRRLSLSASSSVVCSRGPSGPPKPSGVVRRTWATAVRRRSPRIPLIAALTAAVALGVGLAALATWWISGDLFERASAGSGGGAVKASLPAVVGAVIAVALVVLYRRQKDSERAQFAQRFGAASTQLGDSDTTVRIAGVYAMAAAADESPVFARAASNASTCCAATCVCRTNRIRAATISANSSPHNVVGESTGGQHRGDTAASDAPERS